MQSHLSTFKLDIPSEVTVIGTGCKKNTFGEGRTPTIHLIEPRKCTGTEPHGSKPETTVRVLWGPDSFLFRSDILSKCPSKHTEIVMDSHSISVLETSKAQRKMSDICGSAIIPPAVLLVHV